MNLEQYQRTKRNRLLNERNPRCRCSVCRRPESTCYCSQIISFPSDPLFVILMHREEVKRSVATGRMTHLILSNSFLFEGTDFTHDERVNKIINDPANYSVVLYPGMSAANLTQLDPIKRAALFPEGKKLIFFIIDGTWSQAKRVKRLSTNLSLLPQVCFTPSKPSAFLVRKQPRENCYSTIESAHEIIELLEKDRSVLRKNLIDVFTYMVKQQVGYLNKFGAIRGFRSTRGNRIPAISVSQTLHTAHSETTDQV